MTSAVQTSKATAGYSGDGGGVAYRWAGAAPAIPATAVESLDDTSIDLGIITDAGVGHTIAKDTTDRKDIKGKTYYTQQTSVDHTFTLTLADSTDLDVLRTIVGDDNVLVDGEGNVTVRHNAKVSPRRSWVFDFSLDQGVKRSFIEVGQVISIGDITHVSSEMYEFAVTIKVFEGPRIDGDFVRDMYAWLDGSAMLGVSTALLPSGTVGAEYGHVVRAVGGTAPYTYEAESGLPDGLTLSADGEISGTPTTEGESSVVVKVTDAGGAVARKTLPLVIAGA